MSATAQTSDDVQFANELAAPASLPSTRAGPFKILIVDDDRDIHLITKHVLNPFYSKGEAPTFLDAYNSLDAYTLLAWERDIAVVLLDVVMESDDAGLSLISAIRGDLNLSRTQIILRTGQPGKVSAGEVVATYDINGYLAKSDLTPFKLFSAVTTARRAYEKLCADDAKATSTDSKPHVEARRSVGSPALEGFTLNSMAHIAALFQTSCMGFVVSRVSPNEPLYVTVASPEFSGLSELSLEAIKDPAFTDRVESCLAKRQSIIDHDAATLFLPGVRFTDAVMHLVREADNGPVESRLLEILIASYVTGSEILC